jgi:glycosyltransferase involved in cell wall biosynthesis
MSSYIVNQSGISHLLGAPIGLPPNLPSTTQVLQVPSQQGLPPPEIPGQGLQRAVNYLADYGGCSWYRCMGPNLMLNLYQKGVIMELTSMVLDPRFYQGVSAVKIQRQATPQQREFVKLLKEISKQVGFKIIYEIDDIVFREDIPDFNRNKEAFTSDEIRGSILDIMNMCDEVTVTCDFMRDYFIEKTGNAATTVIPNYLLKWWFDRYYNLTDIIKNYEKNKNKPVISIFASGTHVDVTNRTNQKDDFTAIVDAVVKTRKQFKWQFYGCYPLPLKPFVDSGEVLFKQWVDLPDFPAAMAASGSQLTFAALEDNNFNRAKSNIKLIEAGALGIPCVCPDMVTYKDAILKYKTGDEFIDQIKYALKDQDKYVKLCKQSRTYSEKFWLEDEKNLMKHHEAYFTPYGSPSRKYLLETNPKKS